MAEVLKNAVISEKDLFIDIIEEEFSDIIYQYNDDEAAEFVASKIGYDVYNSRNYENPCIVINVKGEGFPSFDGVMHELKTNFNIPDDDPELSYITENELVNLVYQEISFWDEDAEIFYQEKYDLDYVRVGRSGGFVGFEYSPDMIGIKKQNIVSAAVTGLWDGTITKESLSSHLYGVGDIQDSIRERDYEYLADIIASRFFDHYNWENFALVTQKTREAAEEFEEDLSNAIRRFERPYKWAVMLYEMHYE